jgi:hypothetical protein
MAMETDMPRELKAEQELLEIVSKALDASADTTGWSPTGIQEHAMRTQSREQHPNGDNTEHNIDEAVEDTFPASDPPSMGGVTKIRPESDQKKSHGKHLRAMAG